MEVEKIGRSYNPSGKRKPRERRGAGDFEAIWRKIPNKTKETKDISLKKLRFGVKCNLDKKGN